MQNSNENKKDKNSLRLIDVLSDEIPDLPIKEHIDRSKRFEDFLRSTNNIDTVKVKPENPAIAQQLEELKQLRKDFDDHHADDAANRAAEEHRTKIAERKASIKGVIATFVVTVLAGIVLYYWPQIVSLVQRFIH